MRKDLSSKFEAELLTEFGSVTTTKLNSQLTLTLILYARTANRKLEFDNKISDMAMRGWSLDGARTQDDSKDCRSKKKKIYLKKTRLTSGLVGREGESH